MSMASDNATVTNTEQTKKPSRDNFNWEESTKSYGPATYVMPTTETGRITLSSSTGNRNQSSIPTEAVGLIVNGVDAYKNEFGGTVLDVPAYYSRFEDEFSPHMVSASVSSTYSHAYGIGINASRLEQAIRVATGGGRFSVSDITVTACGDNPFVVETDSHAFLIAPKNLKQKPDEHDPFVETVNGIQIEDEQCEVMLEGIEVFIEQLSSVFDITVTGHSHRTNGSHVFTTNNDEYDTISVSWDTLKILSQLMSRDEILGQHEYEGRISLYDTEYTIREDHLEYDIGESGDVLGACIGYKISVSDKSVKGVRIRPQSVHVSLGDRFHTSTYNGGVVVGN